MDEQPESPPPSTLRIVTTPSPPLMAITPAAIQPNPNVGVAVEETENDVEQEAQEPAPIQQQAPAPPIGLDSSDLIRMLVQSNPADYALNPTAPAVFKAYNSLSIGGGFSEPQTAAMLNPMLFGGAPNAPTSLPQLQQQQQQQTSSSVLQMWSSPGVNLNGYPLFPALSTTTTTLSNNLQINHRIPAAFSGNTLPTHFPVGSPVTQPSGAQNVVAPRKKVIRKRFPNGRVGQDTSMCYCRECRMKRKMLEMSQNGAQITVTHLPPPTQPQPPTITSEAVVGLEEEVKTSSDGTTMAHKRKRNSPDTENFEYLVRSHNLLRVELQHEKEQRKWEGKQHLIQVEAMKKELRENAEFIKMLRERIAMYQNYHMPRLHMPV